MPNQHILRCTIFVLKIKTYGTVVTQKQMYDLKLEIKINKTDKNDSLRIQSAKFHHTI